LSRRAPQDIWLSDLDALETALDVFEECIEEGKRQELAAQRKAGKAGTAKRAGQKPAKKAATHKKRPVNSDSENDSEDFDNDSDSDFEVSAPKIKATQPKASTAPQTKVQVAPAPKIQPTAAAKTVSKESVQPLKEANKPAPKDQPIQVQEAPKSLAERLMARLNNQASPAVEVINDEDEVVWTGLASNSAKATDILKPVRKTIKKKVVVSDSEEEPEARFEEDSDSDFEDSKPSKVTKKRPLKDQAKQTSSKPAKKTASKSKPSKDAPVEHFSPGAISSPREVKKARQLADAASAVTNLSSNMATVLSPLAKPKKVKAAPAAKKPAAAKKAAPKKKKNDSEDENDDFELSGSDCEVVAKRPSPKPVRARKLTNYAQFYDDNDSEAFSEDENDSDSD
jgi:hypothetical protein